jgi:acetyltransferase-like isoleucine patch superfamily enzyme
MGGFDQIKKLYTECKKSESSFISVFTNYLLFRLRKKNILADHQVRIKGLQNIETTGLVKIGLNRIGFMNKHDRTFLNINGKLIFKGDYTIGKGCRFDVATGATVEIGKGGYVNPNTLFIIMNGLKIGDGCSISWNCQFLDEDFHEIEYENKKSGSRDKTIEIGNHVWIGSNVFIYKGVKIPNGCVVAANSVVRGSFLEENVLIGGNPAKILKQNVRWG